MMTTFDLSEPTLSCGQRDVTIVPTQALALLNHQFVHDRSERLAIRIQHSVDGIGKQVAMAWRSILKREPNASELERSLEHLATQTKLFSKQSESGSPAFDQAGVLIVSAKFGPATVG